MLISDENQSGSFQQYCCGINNGNASLLIQRTLDPGSNGSQSAAEIVMNIGSNNPFSDQTIGSNYQITKTGTSSNWGISGEQYDNSPLPSQSFDDVAYEWDIAGTGQDQAASSYDPQNANKWFIYLAPKMGGFSAWAASTAYAVGSAIHATNAAGVDSVYTAAPATSTTAAAAAAIGATSITLANTTGFAQGATITDLVLGSTAKISSVSGSTVFLASPFTEQSNSGSWQTSVATGDAIVVATAGTSGSSAPVWPNSGTVTDGTVTWTYQKAMAFEVGTAIWLDNGEDSRTSYGTGWGTNGRFLNAVIDTSLATLANSTTAAVRVGSNQPIDLSGTATAAGQNKHTVVYSTTISATLPGATGTTVTGATNVNISGVSLLSLFDGGGKPFAQVNGALRTSGVAVLGDSSIGGGYGANLGGTTSGFDTTGLTVGWNETNQSQETDLITGQGGLNIYPVSSSGTIGSMPALSMNSLGGVTTEQSLTGTTNAEANAYNVNVTGGGLNGPGYAQKLLQIVGTKANWDTANALTGELDGLVIVTQQGGPVGADSTGATADTSAALIVSKGNHNGFSNVLEAQAQQYPYNGGNPDAEIDVQLGNELAAHQGGVGLALNLVYTDPNLASGAGNTALTINTPGGTGVSGLPSWTYFVRAANGGSSPGVKWSVDGNGNESLAGYIEAGPGQPFEFLNSAQSKTSYLGENASGYVQLTSPQGDDLGDLQVDNLRTTAAGSAVFAGPVSVTGTTTLAATTEGTVTTVSASGPLSAGECGGLVNSTATSNIVLTVPLNLPTICRIAIVQSGAGQVSFVGATGETVNPASVATTAQYSGAVVRTLSASTAVVFGGD